MPIKRIILISGLILVAVCVTITYAAVRTGFLIVEYDYTGDVRAEREMFNGSDIITNHQDAISIYRSEPKTEPVIGFGWLYCRDENDGVLGYNRLINIRLQSKNMGGVGEEYWYEVPIETIDVSARDITNCYETMILFIQLERVWCPIPDMPRMCLFVPRILIVPFGQGQKIKLDDQSGSNILTVRTSIWEVIEKFSTKFGLDRFSLQQAARTIDFFGIEKDTSKITLSKYSGTQIMNIRCDDHDFCRSEEVCPCDNILDCSCSSFQADTDTRECINKCGNEYKCRRDEDCACLLGCKCKCLGDGRCEPYDCEFQLTQLIKETVDRIWGQCGIQFKFLEHWGRVPIGGAAVNENSYQFYVRSELSFPAGISTQQTSSEFMLEANSRGAFNDKAINIYLFPRNLLSGYCPEEPGSVIYYGASYPRERWDVGVSCPIDEFYCRGGDVFINNAADCTAKMLGDVHKAYKRLARTIAHEIGHILLQTAEHYTCSSNSDDSNLMAAQGENGCVGAKTGEGYKLVPAQCTTARGTVEKLNWLLAD